MVLIAPFSIVANKYFMTIKVWASENNLEGIVIIWPFRVVKATCFLRRQLKRVDLPTFGRPTMPIERDDIEVIIAGAIYKVFFTGYIELKDVVTMGIYSKNQ